jgi:ribonuclease-3
MSLGELIASLPPELRTRALTHSSWVELRVDSYGRLAFLGDSVLGLAVAEHLFRENPQADIGRLTKVHGQAVSGRACAAVAEELGLPAMVREVEVDRLEGGIDVEALLSSERALASVCEAAIGACYLHHGFQATAEATVETFSDQIAIAAETLLDYKSALQERLARGGTRVTYAVTGEAGPPHDRRFEVDAVVDGEVIGRGSGRSKKAAEQEAAARAMERLDS